MARALVGLARAAAGRARRAARTLAAVAVGRAAGPPQLGLGQALVKMVVVVVVVEVVACTLGQLGLLLCVPLQ